MPTLISVNEMRERFDIDGDIGDTRLEPHIGAASRRLRGWVGAAAYDAAAATPVEGQDADSDTVNDLKSAEAHLAFHYALLGWNSPLSGKGVVATAMSAEGSEVRKYLSPDETGKLSAMFLERAREIAAPYCAATADADFSIVGAGDCCLPDTSCEAVTRSEC